MALEFRQARDFGDAAQEFLPRLICRMRLAREDKHHRPLFVGDDFAQPVEILEEQRGALVGGEAPREPDREHVRIHRVGEPQRAIEMRLRPLVAQMLPRGAETDQMQHLRLERLVHAPEQVIGYRPHRALAHRILQALVPAGAELAVEEFMPFIREESRHVHAVGNVGQRVVDGFDLRPQRRADARRHRAVDARHAVLKARAADRQRGHVELAAAGVASERDQHVGVDSEVAAHALEVTADHVFAEMVVAGRHRRMGREHGARRHRFQRRRIVEALRGELAHAFEHQKGGVPFVDVPYGGRQAHFMQRAHAAYAEHDLLLEARAAVAAIELVRDIAVGNRVLFDVGIQQEQPHLADLHPPDLRHDIAVGQADLDAELHAVVAHDRSDRQVIEVGIRVLRVLAALDVYGLRKITLAVKKPDADERQRQVARRFAVIAREDAEPARINRQALVKAELGAKVGDQIAFFQAAGGRGGRRGVAIGIEGGQHPVITRQEYRIGGGADQAVLADSFQEGFRAVTDGVPEGEVQPGKQRARGAIPAVPQVIREFFEPDQPLRNAWIYFELISDAGHAASGYFPKMLEGRILRHFHGPWGRRSVSADRCGSKDLRCLSRIHPGCECG